MKSDQRQTPGFETIGLTIGPLNVMILVLDLAFEAFGRNFLLCYIEINFCPRSNAALGRR
jgi:hypothetical protein